jgi:ABC-type thiamine transport system ATPase subunit
VPRPFGHASQFLTSPASLSIKMADMQRVSVVGNAGAGRSHFAQR